MSLSLPKTTLHGRWDGTMAGRGTPPNAPPYHRMMENPLLHSPTSATSTAMEGLEDWELLGEDRAKLKEKDPGEAFVREIREVEVAPQGTPDDGESGSHLLFGELGVGEGTKVGEHSESHLSYAVKPLIGGAVVIADENKGEGEEEGEGRGHCGDGKESEMSKVEEKGFGFGGGGWMVTVCSVGAAAAATICLLVLSGRHQQRRQQQNQKLQLQTRRDEKGMKQAMQQATTLNQAIAVVKAVPMSRAHLSFGGHYDVL